MFYPDRLILILGAIRQIIPPYDITTFRTYFSTWLCLTSEINVSYDFIYNIGDLVVIQAALYVSGGNSTHHQEHI